MSIAVDRVTLLASRIGADEKRLLAEFERRRVPVDHVDTRQLVVAAGEPIAPGVALNREIGHVRALYAAHSLERGGVTVVNSAAATELCGDKWRSTLALQAAGLPVPRTALALTPDAALDAMQRIGYPAVIKPLVGSWGRLVAAVPDRSVATALMDHVAALPSPQSHVVYVQELVDKPARDIRVIVVGGAVVGATYRYAGALRTNVALGATVAPCPVDDELTGLAVAASHAVGARIAGVDLIEDGAGRLLVLEVNHRVEFSGFSRAHGDRLDVAARIVDEVIRVPAPEPPLEVLPC